MFIQYKGQVSNTSRVCRSHLARNAFGNSVNLPLLPSYGLISRACINKKKKLLYKKFLCSKKYLLALNSKKLLICKNQITQSRVTQSRRKPNKLGHDEEVKDIADR